MTRRYMKPDNYLGPRTVRFIPVKNGDVVELGDTGIPGRNGGYGTLYSGGRGAHTFLGFKPATGPKVSGWIVVLVSEDAHAASKPRKHRAVRGETRLFDSHAIQNVS